LHSQFTQHPGTDAPNWCAANNSDSSKEQTHTFTVNICNCRRAGNTYILSVSTFFTVAFQIRFLSHLLISVFYRFQNQRTRVPIGLTSACIVRKKFRARLWDTSKTCTLMKEMLWNSNLWQSKARRGKL
jgi:hypothetical protein